MTLEHCQPLPSLDLQGTQVNDVSSLTGFTALQTVDLLSHINADTQAT
jgi:hypothetical protein